jgi:hypothetical protein
MPCDYKKYPLNWKSEIRPAILKRDGNCCKFCGIENKAIGWRDCEGNFVYADDYLKTKQNGFGFYQTSDRLKIVLTIMHLDHNIKNNDYANLAAGCQKCHLNYDKVYHKQNSKETLLKKKKLQKLF